MIVETANWTEAQVETFVNCIGGVELAKGSSTDNGLKKQTWSDIVNKFNQETNLGYSKSQLQFKVMFIIINCSVLKQMSIVL
jgi:hypothetical protein